MRLPRPSLPRRLSIPSRPSRPPPFALKYYAYRATTAVAFTAPVWYIYLKLVTGTYTLVAAANAVWWTSLVLFEIPTGYLGDRIGRRRALLAGSLLTTLATAGMAFVGSFPEVAVAFVVWAAGSTFRSGTDDAWLYETVSDRLEPGDFARVRGRGGSVARVMAGITALAGGYVATGAMSNAYLASAAVSLLAVPVVLSLPAAPDAGSGDADDGEADAPASDSVEADSVEADDTPNPDDTFTVLDALPVLREQFSRPPLRSFVLLVALYSGVHWGVNFFVQPVSLDLGLSRAGLGWLFAGFTAVTAVVSYHAGAIEERVGVRGWFRTVPVGMAVAFLAVAAAPVLALPVFVLMRGLRGAVRPLANQFVNDHAGDVGRATVLSAAGMVYNLVTVPFELTAGRLADATDPVTTIGLFGAVLLVGSLAVLGVGSPFGDGPAADGVDPSAAD